MHNDPEPNKLPLDNVRKVAHTRRMTKRIPELTDDMRATFPEWVDRWTGRTGPHIFDRTTITDLAAERAA